MNITYPQHFQEEEHVTITSRTAISLALATAATVLALTGCSAPAAPAATTASTAAPSVASTPTATPTPRETETAAVKKQTKKEACAIAKKGAETAAKGLSESAAMLSSDLPTAAANMTKQARKFSVTMDKITNKDISGPARKADAAATELAERVSAAAKDRTKIPEIESALTGFQTGFYGLATPCGGA